MSFTKISELTATEFIGLAFAQFGHRRYTIAVLTHYLSSILADSFKVGHVKDVEGLNRIALENGLVRMSEGRNGGVGFEVTEQGVEDAAEIELPRSKFEQHAVMHEERSREANANAGPVFDALLRAAPEKDVHGRAFIEKVLKHWLTHGWLSSRQVGAIARIGARYGQFIQERHYIGNALEVWTTPYVQKLNEQRAADQAAYHARILVERERKAEEERTKMAVRDENRRARAAIMEIEMAGGLAELDALVSAVFPNANGKKAAKALAFVGSGSKELRACTAMVAFCQPPSSVWKPSGNRQQPDAQSDVWKTLVAHESCRAIIERHERAGILAKPGIGAADGSEQQELTSV
ncbi:hypothetical protein KY495_20575 [Massilia sp. PAMC28688]|uniref:hypothetical protein n=1 Tax=Massilia sp. PAMC28688 TaxID=2861283 RepID=UPI001C632C91|nr:hypothetical protein [Massilia sp. PAMC28688]QYF93065.1 hypothetical protein KY495_20575 [Massilia sp. PAMC28688]